MGRQMLYDRTKIAEMLSEGKRPREIKNLLGCPNSLISLVRRKLGIEPFRHGRPMGIPANPEWEQAILDCIQSGSTQSETARKFNIQRQRVNQIVHRQRYEARSRCGWAIVDGRIKRPDQCSKCGKQCSPQAHHEDYNFAFKVAWLCTECHSRVPKVKEKRFEKCF